MLKFCTLASGSNGNCTFVSDGEHRILIDAGISARAITRGLQEIGESPETLDGIFITHEHWDHIRGLEVLEKKHPIPIYAAREGTADALCEQGPQVRDRISVFATGQEISLGNLQICSFSTPHDTPHSVGFRVESGDSAAVVMTDLGHVPEAAEEMLYGADLILMEANYDEDALWHGTYPPMLKKRIAGPRGHLSNADCAACASRAVQNGTKTIILGHLSAENNTPKLAYDTVHSHLMRHGLIPGVDMMLQVAPRGARGAVYTLGTEITEEIAHA